MYSHFRAALVAIFIVSTGFALGCDKKSDDSTGSNEEKAKKASSISDQGGEIPAVCKTYETKWKRCVLDPTPKEYKKATKEDWDRAMASWKVNAQTAEGRKNLEESCEQMLEALPKDCDKK